MVSCLRGLDAQVVTNQEMNAVNISLLGDPFPPILDGLFAVENPGPLGTINTPLSHKPDYA